ncbi:hypothetical protein [Methanolobus sp. ZRKC5]|uniref:hypothetical protein n=1 Tax=unclassified Methanolobus TaxID=2629569 RepID=UPI00313F3B4B
MYILKAKKIKKIYIPYYLCDSIGFMLSNNGYEYEYYNINLDLTPIFNKELDEDEYLYIVNYFGQLENEKIIHLKKKYRNIILDNVMAFFQRPLKNIDTIYSCRKFFGVPDGAYVSTDTLLNEELDFASSKDRMKHLLGRFEGNAFEYYNDFQKTELSYKVEPLKNMSKISKNIIGAIDFNKVIQIRNDNYKYLEHSLNHINRLRCVAPNGAFAYPLYIDNGIELRKELAEMQIYIPTLWPNVLQNTPQNSVEYQYAANILPLPCDQRYCKEDIDYMYNALISLIK